MPVLAFLEINNNSFKKSAFETTTYAAKTAAALSTEAFALCFGDGDNATIATLGEYGIKNVWHVTAFTNQNPALWAKAVKECAGACSADIIICSHDYTGKAVAPVLSGMMQAGIIGGVTSLPEIADGKFTVRRNVFSGKAIAWCVANSEKKIISVLPNSIPVEKNGTTCEVIDFTPAETTDSRYTVKETIKASGKVSLTDAELVVSAGRGLKGPENWGMIEEMADILGAATACSRAVSDVHWRPHTEHVGQTGLTIRPNLYIAVGISGAIQHLAGVNGSKVIVVINKDPEAPFFKAADYGIVGDAFEVVPKLNQALRKFKQGA